MKAFYHYPFRLEGKIIVDTNIEKIEHLLERSKNLSMEGVKILTNQELSDKEPNSTNFRSCKM